MAFPFLVELSAPPDCRCAVFPRRSCAAGRSSVPAVTASTAVPWLREGPGGSRVACHKDVTPLRELCRPARWCIAPGHDAFEHESWRRRCASVTRIVASSRLRSDEAIAPNYGDHCREIGVQYVGR